MHERKALMAELSDGFIALPGGIGTLEELFEVWTWAQLGSHSKPCALLNVLGYYDRLLGFLDFVVGEAFMRPMHRNMLLVSETPEALLEKMESYRAPPKTRWIAATSVKLVTLRNGRLPGLQVVSSYRPALSRPVVAAFPKNASENYDGVNASLKKLHVNRTMDVNAGAILHRRAGAKMHHPGSKKAPDIGGLLAFAAQS